MAREIKDWCLGQSSPSFETSEADEAVGGLNEPSNIRWCDPLPADRQQVLVGRLTGDRTPLSNVDRHVVLLRLGEQLAHGWHADTLQAVADSGLEQFGCVPGKYHADVVTDFQRPVDGEVKRDRGVVGSELPAVLMYSVRMSRAYALVGCRLAKRPQKRWHAAQRRDAPRNRARVHV